MKFAVVSGFLVFISEALKILNAPPLLHSWNVFSRLECVELRFVCSKHFTTSEFMRVCIRLGSIKIRDRARKS